jgi:DNA-binding NarL/FixJ family response regulator
LGVSLIQIHEAGLNLESLMVAKGWTITMIRVALTEDHPDMREALRELLSLSRDIELVSETENGKEAVDCAEQIRPDVLVMAINIPVINGFAATKQISDLRVPTRVILISLDNESYILSQAAAVGAQGFVSKDHAATQLLSAIRTVHRGETYFVE